jgi:hypothetical protein
MSDVAGGQTQSTPDSMASVAVTTVERADANPQPDRANKPTGDETVVDRDDTRSHISTAVAAASGRPERIRKLLERTPLVVDCEEASVWSARGRLGIDQSSPVEVLLYIAAAPLLHQGRLAEWSGVKPKTLLAEIWAPRARDPDNRDSAQTWLGKNLGRLQDEIGGATGGLDAQMIVKRQGGLHLNEDVVVSDVETFIAALERARAVQGPDRIRAAEEAFALRTPGLLSRVVRKPRTAARKLSSIVGWAKHTGSVPRGDSKHWGVTQRCCWRARIATLGATRRRWRGMTNCSGRTHSIAAPARAC